MLFSIFNFQLRNAIDHSFGVPAVVTFCCTAVLYLLCTCYHMSYHKILFNWIFQSIKCILKPIKNGQNLLGHSHRCVRSHHSMCLSERIATHTARLRSGARESENARRRRRWKKRRMDCCVEDVALHIRFMVIGELLEFTHSQTNLSLTVIKETNVLFFFHCNS